MEVRALVALCVVANAQDLFLPKANLKISTGTGPHEQAKAIVAKMTLKEKVHMTHGNSSTVYAACANYVGCVPGIERLGIPALRMQDGPQGFRSKARKYDGTSTQWPSGMTMGMSWDVDLMTQWGKAMGKEFFAKGADVAFGPAVNVHRVPLNGRNFEYISGEDPFLGKTLVKPLVQAMQSTGIIANVKHYLDNNQEGQNGPVADTGGAGGPGDRHSTSSNVDERTQVEIYFPPFQGAIDGGVLSAMCGNNLVNGEHICQSNFTQNTLLRDWGGFEGFMCSDYRGTQSTIGSALGGLDMQLPGCQKVDPSDPSGLTCVKQPQRPNFYGQPLEHAVRKGWVPEAVLDSKVERILYAMISSGVMNRTMKGDATTNVTSPEHNALAHKFAVQSAVLLQNKDSMLPLDAAKAKRSGIAVIGAAGHDKVITGGGGSGRVQGPYSVSVLDGLRSTLGENAVSYYGGADISEAGALAAKSGYAVVVLASLSEEGHDRLSLDMPDAALVEAVASKQPNTIVVVAAPGAFLAPWADHVQSVLSVFYSGQEQGHAVADLLLGSASPSGKLVLTIPNKENEVGFSQEQYPGKAFQGNCTLGFPTCYNADYSEKLEVGYRWYNAHGITPKFPFGHGLTYSSFKLSGIKISGHAVSALLENTGAREAAEVVQLYLTYPAAAQEPPRQLRGFAKVSLAPGAKRTVDFRLGDEDFAIWDVKSHSWQQVKGSYKIEVGTSSADLPLSQKVDV